MNNVRIAQVGIANHGRTILNAIAASGNLELTSIFDIDDRATEETARTLGVHKAVSYEEILSDENVDAVALVTPNHLHAKQTKQAALSKKHVFVEKPIANCTDDACEMIDAMREANLVLMVGHNTRRKRVFRRAKQLLAEGFLGTIVSVEMNMSRPAGLQSGLPAWKADPEKSALLPMMQLGIHFVDAVEYLLGPLKSVQAIAASRAMSDVKDSVSALMTLADGIPVTLSSSYVTPDVYFVRIYGTHGIIHCTPSGLRTDRASNGEIKETHHEDFSSEGAESYVLQMREFGECVRAGTHPETDGEGGLRALAVIEGMLESIQTGRRVDLSTTSH